MAVVEPDRFDDVEYRVLEEPEPPRRPRLKQWTFGALSVVVATGVMASGASAINDDDAAPSAKSSQKGGAVIIQTRDHRDCDKPHGRRNTDLKY